MTTVEVMSRLEAAGTAQNRKIYARHGMREPFFGVSFAVLEALKKAIKTDHALARALWATGNGDARNLACMIADPAAATSAELDRWLAEMDSAFVVGIFVQRFVLNTSLARAKAFEWMQSKREWTAQAGWKTIAGGADTAEHPELFSDDELLPLLKIIERDIHSAPNRVRQAMNEAIIGIGVRGGVCEKAALATAKRVGPVEVDHGETGCKTPDAAEYIAKTLAHRAAKAAKKTSIKPRAAGKKR